ncbi:MAG: 2-amino-4-hydroxy-6-hydroxymethyldihydropteridine diphosphokinase [Bacteroidia bacterium]|nr:2-amino-4-hydroxy-6-hydroxymethyldihydropteridine diphosphokinase [Bacteroidia bacterium]
MQNRVVVLLGGNLGDRSVTLQHSRMELETELGTILMKSGIYESAPWGFDTVVPNFYNQVLVIETVLSPRQVLKKTQEIECALGRVRSLGKGYQSRSIDIDILFYNDWIVKENALTLPHARIASRRFVLVPLAEVLPDFLHPELHCTITALLNQCNDPLPVKRVDENE